MSQSPQPAPAPSDPTAGVPVAKIDASCRWPLFGLYCGAAFWLVMSAIAYLIASMSFHAPAMFADCPAFSYGRMAPAASNLLIYGFCIPAGWAAVLWMLARLGQTSLPQGASVMIGSKLWNLGVLLGTIGILVGGSTGFENVEFPLYAAWPLLIGALLIGVSGIGTLRAREKPMLHPVQWFAGLSILWFPWIYLTAVVFLQIWPVRGMAQAAVHGWYVAQLQVVLLGLMGVAALFFFMPALKRKPLPSWQLALFALFTLIFCGGWTGIPAVAPAPAWMPVISQVMSVFLILPVLAVVLNLWNLRSGYSSSEARFFQFGVGALVLWTVMSVVLNVTGANKCLAPTLVQPALEQLFFQGFSLMASLGAAYCIIPRIAGRDLPFAGFSRAHFWLAAVGLVLVVIPFLLGGLKQGAALADVNVPFTEVASGTLMPIRVASMGQLLLIVGHALLIVNLVALMIGLVRVNVKSFDNAPLGAPGATEGRA